MTCLFPSLAYSHTHTHTHTSKADVPAKLPTLYLIDSVVKNLGGDYQSYFSKSIQALFCHVFETCVSAVDRVHGRSHDGHVTVM